MIHEVQNSIIFLNFKTSVVIVPHLRASLWRIAYGNWYATNPLNIKRHSWDITLSLQLICRYESMRWCHTNHNNKLVCSHFRSFAKLKCSMIWEEVSRHSDKLWTINMTHFPLTLHDGVRYHIETSPLICRTNQWTGFYMLTASDMKELKCLRFLSLFIRNDFQDAWN